jgi:flagellar basal body-associated protein FliL
MKQLVSITVVLIAVAFLVSLTFANPATLPKHKGYPIGKPTSPVTGQSLANDTGQTAADSAGEAASIAAAGASTEHVSQNLKDSNNDRIQKNMGAGRLPQVQGPDIEINPPVKEATRMR